MALLRWRPRMLRTLFGKAGLVQVPVGNVGVQMGGWFRKEINRSKI